MMKAAAPEGGDINSIAFLTMFADMMEGACGRCGRRAVRPTGASADVDAEETIMNAFKCFDSDKTPKGMLEAEECGGAPPMRAPGQGRHLTGASGRRLRRVLTTMGDKRMTDEEVDELLDAVPAGPENVFDYKNFTRVLKHGGC